MQKRQISAREVLKDVRGGLDDFALMQKYKVTSKGLDSLFQKLVAAGLISQSELDTRSGPLAQTVVLDL
ncbi:MAG: hypothetical protein FJ118_17080 [Deltaproteobacteria bacterium]|nr:hypothetical protein [Deltaproteobacteria bacterium]